MSRRHTIGQHDGSSRASRQIVRSRRRGARLGQPSRRERRVARRRGPIQATPVRLRTAHPRTVRDASQAVRWTLPAIVTGAMATALAMRQVDLAGHGPVGPGVALPWLAGLAMFALAAWWPGIRAARPRRWGGAPVRTWGPWLALAILAAAPRVVRLDRFPVGIDGDEGQLLLMAAAARDGTMANPFATGWLGVPHLYPAAQGWLASLAGDDLAGHRLLGGLVGTVGVLATWRFGRRVIGEWQALSGAALLAIMPYHLYFSRSALNHVTDPTTLMFALLFLWRGVRTGRGGDAFLCGVMVGLGWYGYWGARVYPLIVALVLAVAATDRRMDWRRAPRLAAWATLGFVATVGPLLAWFRNNPAEFRNRLVTTSPISRDALRDAPAEVTRLYLANLEESVLLPVSENMVLFYRHPMPFVGWPMAFLLVVGLAVWIVGVIRAGTWRRAAWFLVPWLVLTLGVAATHPVQGQRFMAMAPIWALLAGMGLVSIARWVSFLAMRQREVAWRVLVVGTVAVLAIVNLSWAASEQRQLTTYGDPRSVAASDIGWRLANGGGEREPPPVLFLGAPYMFIGDWGSVRFQAPGAVLTDLDAAIWQAGVAPALPAGTILILVPERAGERCLLEVAYPEATVSEARAWNGALLYIAFHRGDLPGWSTDRSPHVTTFTRTAETPCAAGSLEAADQSRKRRNQPTA